VGDAESDAGSGEAGTGAEGAVVPEGAAASASAGGMAAGDASGGGDSCGADCGQDALVDQDGVPGGACGTETEDQAGSAGGDGACARMRPGVRAGAVAAVAGGPRTGTGGAGAVEEALYGEKIVVGDQWSEKRGSGRMEFDAGLRQSRMPQ